MKAPMVEANAKKTQRRGSDKKPIVLETGTENQTQQKAQVAQFQVPEDLWLR